MPQDDSSARLALQQALSRQHPRERQNQIELLPSTNNFLAGLWVFGALNSQYQLLGGPRYKQMYLAGPLVVPSRDLGLGSFSVTTQFTAAFNYLLSRRAPKSEPEALDVAHCAAALLDCTRPDRLKILGASEVPPALLEYLTRAQPENARWLVRQVAAPKVEPHQSLSPGGPSGLVYTVELCTYSPESWGDIVFWHMEIGSGLFSASRRPIYLAPRVLE